MFVFPVKPFHPELVLFRLVFQIEFADPVKVVNAAKAVVHHRILLLQLESLLVQPLAVAEFGFQFKALQDHFIEAQLGDFGMDGICLLVRFVVPAHFHEAFCPLEFRIIDEQFLAFFLITADGAAQVHERRISLTIFKQPFPLDQIRIDQTGRCFHPLLEFGQFITRRVETPQ